MLLTVTYEGENTQELGFLLHKNPARAQQFQLSFGQAYVFYPEVSDSRTTAALLLDIDPLDLARGKVGSSEGGLFDYVNDRPYASTSFLSTAIARVFNTAISGKCAQRQALADTPLDLTAHVYALRDGRFAELAEMLFAPLGYTVSAARAQLDEQFPEWGISPYIDLTLRGKVRLCELLNHLYVLIPVFDQQKHYYMGRDEIQKLLDHGAGWLAQHPEKERIVRRYFPQMASYARHALSQLEEELAEIEAENDPVTDPEADPETDSATAEAAGRAQHTPLNTVRLEAVRDAVLASGAASVIDLGCGECRLTALLLNEPQIRHVTACDVSVRELEKAAQRLHLDRMNEHKKQKLTLMQASLTYLDKRFSGFDCACIVEVIEHIEPMRIPAIERVVFEYAVPKTVIVTTPNREYNAKYENMPADALRHGDHRFEWTRAEFAAWASHICGTFGYSVEISGIGETDAQYGAPTQMGVFTKHG